MNDMMASSSSTPSSPRSVASGSNPFERYQNRMSLDHLLQEANLDRDTLLQVLKENQVGMNDLDESKIQSIVKQATKKQKNGSQSQLQSKSNGNGNLFEINSNPFNNSNANPDMIGDEKKDIDYDGDDVDANGPDKSSINSHYRVINKEFMNLKSSMKNLQNKIKLESYLSDLRQKEQHNKRLLHLQQLSKRKKEVMLECEQMERKYNEEKDRMESEMSNIESVMKSEQNEQENLLLKKIALQQNVSQCKEKLTNLMIEKKKFAEMKDISQFKPIAVFYVLKYLEIEDFISCILCCRAWNYSLNKPCYWRILQRNVIYKNKSIIHEHINKKKQDHELVSNETKLKRINHAVMQLKIEPKKIKKKGRGSNIATPRPDDIYQQCMQQLQKVIAQSEQDREELEERVKAQMGILKFMQTSMYGKMHELAELRVRRWILKQKSQSGYQIEKRSLAEKTRELEENLNKNRMIIETMKDNLIQQEEIRNKKLKIQLDLRSVKSGTSNIEMTNELKKLKQQTKKLAQVIVQLRKEIPKRKQEVKKYKDRVDLLQSQYQQSQQQPLP